jgi:AAA15 family ATPase/GTPase
LIFPSFIEEVTIKEFKGIRQTKDVIKLTKFNVLIGRNNSGKTSLLEALALSPVPWADIPLIGGERRRYFAEKIHNDTSMKCFSYKYYGEAEIQLKILGKNVVIRIGGEAGSGEVKLNEGKYSSSNFSKYVRALGLEDNFMNAVILIPNSDVFLSELKRSLAQSSNWFIVEKTKAHNKIMVEVINKCVDEEFTEVIVRFDELYARKQYPDGTSAYIRVSDLGDGVERALTTLLWLEAIKPKLVLWDDFEASMHPTLAKATIEWLANKDWQVVMATHSIDVLSQLLEVKPKDMQVLLLSKSPDDVLYTKRLSLEELENIIEANQDPRLLVDLLKL